MPNPILDELSTLLDPGLPPRFTLYVPDAWMRGLLEAGMTIAGVPVPTSVRSLYTRLLDYEITLRADSDPEPFAAVH